jgi:hypothetical protein
MRTPAAGADWQPNTDRSPLRVGDTFAAPDQAWMEHAACRGVGAAEFFGTASVRGRKRCQHCPVIESCFWGAIVAEANLGFRYGIWGGATPAVRAQVTWVTGVDYARSRFAACAARWAEPSEPERS